MTTDDTSGTRAERPSIRWDALFVGLLIFSLVRFGAPKIVGAGYR